MTRRAIWMAKVLDFIDRLPLPAALSASVLLVFAVGYVDYHSGYELTVSILYLVPIALAASRARTVYTPALISLLSATVLFTSDIYTGHKYSSLFYPVWNAFIIFCFFIAVAYMLQSIRHLLDVEHELSRKDYLTGLLNLRHFRELGEAEIIRSTRFHRPFAVVYMDVDNFKTINDTHGHDIGSGVLARIGGALRQSIRAMDIASRAGGDEFVLLLAETAREDTVAALERINTALMACVERYPGVSFSIGAAVCDGVPTGAKPPSLDDLIKTADYLMYQVKRSGKNRIECASIQI